jgi:uroporphyrinogen-III synthase
MSSIGPKIALTRESGANDKMLSLLKKYNCVEIPCISFASGDDVNKLGEAILQHDVIAITSPQSAQIFLDVWKSINKPQVKVVTVGKGTSKPLEKEGITPAFMPSDFNAETLAKELPESLGRKILYPTSAIAENVLQQGLESRGFSVTRLNTYTTVAATWSAEELAEAKSVDIATFASPSAVGVWADRVGSDFIAVAIGPGCAKAAQSAGFTKVTCPEGSKGVEAWAAAIETAVQVKLLSL